MTDPNQARLAIPGERDPRLPGPFAVGRWAAGFRDFLRERRRVLLIGEVANFKRARASAYFELRDSEGAVPCAIWTSDLDRLGLPEGALRDGSEVVVAGGPDFYPGTATASPGFSFRVSYLRLAGEGDLFARLALLRAQLDADGLFAPQKRLARPALPKTIGVVAARGSAACADLLAGLERRGWRGTIVWADAPVQDRRAAAAIAAALRDLAALPQVEVAVVCRGGGSLTDLWAFCDEALCRTVALLRLPVISAVGHESDRTLIDDVSAVPCSTPTHAAHEAVRVDVREARAALLGEARVARRTASAAVSSRGRRLAELAGGPGRSVRSERARLHQLLREVRASSSRGIADRGQLTGRYALVASRKAQVGTGAERAARGRLAQLGRSTDLRLAQSMKEQRRRLEALAVAERAHDPERTLERGYALVAGRDGEPITSAAAARERAELVIRFEDAALAARVERKHVEREQAG
ncbi:MAG TPA: exodeoxyribonuclease VII large subunit [Thermoleophilaceae bacterium]|nr:exodeoxyribonuclease VII large subunit [Thermoleophilaceae bacterium]